MPLSTVFATVFATVLFLENRSRKGKSEDRRPACRLETPE